MTLRLLLIDDDSSLRRLLESELAGAGHEVSAVASLGAADELIAQAPFDVAIVDAELDGDDALVWLQEQRAMGRETRFVLLAPCWQPPLRLVEMARRVDASALLVKPFPAAELLAQVAAMGGAMIGPRGAEDAAVSPFEQSLALLLRGYASTLSEKLTDLGALLRVAQSGAPRDVEAAMGAAHKLRGTCGTYGFVAISAATGVMENQLSDVLNGRLQPNAMFWRRLLAAAALALAESPSETAPVADPESGAGAGPEAGTDGKMKVLLVDLDADFVAAATASLAGWGFEVVTTDATATVLGALERHQPVAALAPATTATLSGFDMVRLVRSSTRWQDLPLFLVVDAGDAYGRRAAFAAGAVDVVGRPWIAAEGLARIVRRHIRS